MSFIFLKKFPYALPQKVALLNMCMKKCYTNKTTLYAFCILDLIYVLTVTLWMGDIK